jgi:hypothetical protein
MTESTTGAAATATRAATRAAIGVPLAPIKRNDLMMIVRRVRPDRGLAIIGA